jgi:uncharacterized radical SAM protein YgiQ
MSQTNHKNFPKFIPTTKRELIKLGWNQLDVILVSGDTYIDAPHMGVAIVGKILVQAGFRVGLIAQPTIDRQEEIGRLGEPALFWGVTSGCVDSMVANYTAAGKRRKRDDLTPGGDNNRRPDRAVIVYTNLIRRYFKSTKPIVLGGIEASLRRISHYDAWTKSVRRSILFDAKADVLVYGMAEKAVLELARCLKKGQEIHSIRGICYISKEVPEPTQHFPEPITLLPDHQAVQKDPAQFIQMFRRFYANSDPLTAKRLCQKQDTRYVIQNPPQPYVSQKELDQIHTLPFARMVHPFYSQDGPVKALKTIQFSLISHRGCLGECRFCAITVHQGRKVISRSKPSILSEATGFTSHPDFKGIISDVGGPTANMYAMQCSRKSSHSGCPHKSCLYPDTCQKLSVGHQSQIKLLQALRKLPGVRKVFIASGLRYDLILMDKTAGARYLEEILRHHVSGQLKIAPEHSQKHVLDLMGKPDTKQLRDFIALFETLKRKTKRNLFLTYYLMAAHPGCTIDDMQALKRFARKELRLLPEQVQIFTPTPSTWATVMYHTAIDPFTGRSLFVEKNPSKKIYQKAALTPKHRT